MAETVLGALETLGNAVDWLQDASQRSLRQYRVAFLEALGAAWERCVLGLLGRAQNDQRFRTLGHVPIPVVGEPGDRGVARLGCLGVSRGSKTECPEQLRARRFKRAPDLTPRCTSAGQRRCGAGGIFAQRPARVEHGGVASRIGQSLR